MVSLVGPYYTPSVIEQYKSQLWIETTYSWTRLWRPEFVRHFGCSVV